MILLGLSYTVWLGQWNTLTGSWRLDGQIGVLLGLYICSHPAANGIDLLFYRRDSLRALASRWAGFGWFVLNLATLLAGYMVIVTGAARVAGHVISTHDFF